VGASTDRPVNSTDSQRPTGLDALPDAIRHRFCVVGFPLDYLHVGCTCHSRATAPLCLTVYLVTSRDARGVDTAPVPILYSLGNKLPSWMYRGCPARAQRPGSSAPAQSLQLDVSAG
jgi:hypothetical protein